MTLQLLKEMMNKSLYLLSILTVIVIISCQRKSKEFDENERLVFEKVYYDSLNSILKQKGTFIDQKLDKVCAYSMNGILIDSFQRVNNKISYEIVKEELNRGDTVTFRVKYDNPKYENQYILLTDSVKMNNILGFDNLIQSNNGEYVEISFVCRALGKNVVNGIIFNSSIEVIECINEEEYFGRRVGWFEKFELFFASK